ncbi:MAG: YceH family protein [Phycisphaerae bacterium]
MELQLDSAEQRVFGVLMEKALNLPQYYPMTVNAIVTGCNQKQNRDPVVEFDEDTVWDALERLRAKNLVTKIVAGGSSRADKFKHLAADTCAWQTPQRAILAELLLRGPQTAGELRTRCARMHEFDSVEAVAQTLQRLSELNPPVVRQLARRPGQSANRWMHLIGDAPEASFDEVEDTVPMRSTQVASRSDAPPALTTRVDALEAEIGALKRRLAALESQLGVE